MNKNRSDLFLLNSIPKGVWKYVLYFLVFLVSTIILFNYFQSFFSYVFLKPVSIAGYFILENIGLPIQYSSATLGLGYCDYVLPHQILRVNFGCTGIFVLFVFIAAVFAYPASLRAKAIGLAIGVPFFTLYSILRLVVMGVVGNWIPQYLDLIHNYLMIVINISFVLWLYTFWIDHAVGKTKI